MTKLVLGITVGLAVALLAGWIWGRSGRSDMAGKLDTERELTRGRGGEDGRRRAGRRGEAMMVLIVLLAAAGFTAMRKRST